MSAQLDWGNSVGDMHIKMDEYGRKVQEAKLAVGNYFAPIIETYAKTEAPWTDRTGNARQGLNAGVEELGNEIVAIYLSGGVFYQIFLELAHSGRYAIIMPTLEQHYKPVQDMLQGIFK